MILNDDEYNLPQFFYYYTDFEYNLAKNHILTIENKLKSNSNTEQIELLDNLENGYLRIEDLMTSADNLAANLFQFTPFKIEQVKKILIWIENKKTELENKTKIDTKDNNNIIDNKNKTVQFSEYIINIDANIKAQFLTQLKAKYLINKTSKDYAFMILALKELAIINFKRGIKTHVYSALKSFLNNTDIGTDSALNNTIKEFEVNRNTNLEKNEKNTTHIIDAALKELKPHIETIETILNNLNKTELKK